MRPHLVAAIGLAALTGCTTPIETYHWKSGASVSLIDRDLFACKTAAARDVPVDTRVGQTPIIQTPIQTICRPATLPGGAPLCQTTGGQIMGGEIYSYDANADLRRDYQARCMKGKGYSIAQVPACAAKVIPDNVTDLARLPSRPPVEGACAVALKGGTHVLVYPDEVK